MKQVLMSKGARTVVEVCAGMRPGETAVVVADAHMQPIALAIMAAVRAMGAEPILATMMPRISDGQEPPEPVGAAMEASDVFFCAVSRSITHTRAVRRACEKGSRGIMLTQFTEDMLVRGGIEADFAGLVPICTDVARALQGRSQIRLTTPLGTDLTMSATGRRGNALTCLVGPGQFSPCPNVEANVAPLEGSANGTIVADASIPYIGIGLLEQPVVANVRDGKIVEVSGGRQADILRLDLASKNDPLVYNVAELGIGLNPHCRFTGVMLEDEGVYGSVHIGIGTNITLGGIVKAACHYDLIMTGATIVADGRVILENGQLRVSDAYTAQPLK